MLTGGFDTLAKCARTQPPLENKEVKKGEKTTYLVTGEGFVEITGKSVSVMTDLAQWSEEIDEKAAEDARKRAEEALKQKHTLTNEQFASTAAALEKALASLKVKRRHRKI